MTAVASDDIPDEWGLGDQIHLEVYTRFSRIADMGEYSAICYFANQIIIDHVEGVRTIDDDIIIELDNFLDDALLIDQTIKRILGDNYITDYMKTLEDDNE